MEIAPPGCSDTIPCLAIKSESKDPPTSFLPPEYADEIGPRRNEYRHLNVGMQTELIEKKKKIISVCLSPTRNN